MTVPTGFPVNDGPLIPSWPRVLLQIAWNAGGNSTGPNHWYTVSKRLRGKWTADLAGRQYELDTVQAGTMTFSLDNLDGAFDPDNTSSFFSPNVIPYRRARLVVMPGPSANLLYPWVAQGTSTSSMAASVGTLDTTSGLTASPSGLTTAQTWAIPNGAAAFVAFGLWGDISSWANHDCEGTTVTPGANYSVGIDVQLAPGGMTSLDLKARIGWYDLAGNLVARNTGPVVSVTTAWSRLVLTLRTAPAGAAYAIVSMSTNIATTAATTVRATGWQLEQADAPTAFAYPGNWNQLWQGFVERWTQKYDQNGKYGLVDVTCVDALAPLSQLALNNVMPQWLALQSPEWTFPLGAVSASPDIPGGNAYRDTTGVKALDVIGANITTGTAISSTTDQGTLWNTPGPVVTFANNQAGSLGMSAGASYLTEYDGVTLSGDLFGAWSRMICFRTAVTPGTGGRFPAATLWAATAAGFISGSGDASGVQLLINSSGHAVFQAQTHDVIMLSITNASVNVCDGNWHCAIATMSADGETIRLTVDGVAALNTSALNMHPLTITSDNVGALLAGTSNTQPFFGDAAYFTQWNQELDVATCTSLTAGFATGWASDSIAARISRILTVSQFHPGAGVSYSAIGTAGTLGAVDLSGRSPLDAMQEAADTENGQFAIDRNGTPTLYGHLWRWIQSTPRVIFGENTSSGEVPYLEDIAFEQDPAHLYNDVQITCDGAVDATDNNQVQESSDTASQTAYFPQSLTRTVNPYTVQGGKDIADYLLSQYKDPHTRLDGLTVDLSTDTSRLPKLTGLAMSDLVRVMRRPTLAPVKQLDGFIEKIQWSGDDTGSNLRLALQISPKSQYAYWIVSASWAALTTAPAAGVSVLTTGPVSGNSAIPAQCVIPPGFAMTLGYGTANAETVTVQSVQTVTAGYTTVQLTLAVPTTQPHAAGDVICSRIPVGITLPPGGTYPTCFDTVSEFGNTLIGY